MSLPSLRIVHPVGEYVAVQENKYFVLRVDRTAGVVAAEEKVRSSVSSPQEFQEHILTTYAPLLLDQNLQHMFQRNVSTGARELLSRRPEVDFLFHPLLHGEPANAVPDWMDEAAEEGGAAPATRRRGAGGGGGRGGRGGGSVGGWLDLRGVRRGGWFAGWDGNPRRACKSRIRASLEAFDVARGLASATGAHGAAFLVVRSLSIPYNSHLGDLGFCLQLRLPMGEGKVACVNSDVFKILHHPPRSRDGRYQHVDVSDYSGPPRDKFQIPQASLRCVVEDEEKLATSSSPEHIGEAIHHAVLDDGITPAPLVYDPIPLLFRHSFRSLAELGVVAIRHSLHLLDCRDPAERVTICSPFDHSPDPPPPPEAITLPAHVTSTTSPSSSSSSSSSSTPTPSPAPRRSARHSSASNSGAVGAAASATSGPQSSLTLHQVAASSSNPSAFPYPAPSLGLSGLGGEEGAAASLVSLASKHHTSSSSSSMRRSGPSSLAMAAAAPVSVASHGLSLGSKRRRQENHATTAATHSPASKRGAADGQRQEGARWGGGGGGEGPVLSGSIGAGSGEIAAATRAAPPSATSPAGGVWVPGDVFGVGQFGPQPSAERGSIASGPLPTSLPTLQGTHTGFSGPPYGQESGDSLTREK